MAAAMLPVMMNRLMLLMTNRMASERAIIPTHQRHSEAGRQWFVVLSTANGFSCSVGTIGALSLFHQQQ